MRPDLERVLINGDLSQLSPDDRISYYRTVCESLNLNPLTKPFEYITLNGKLTLYAKRDCTDQLRFRDHISIRITGRELIDDTYVVTAQAKTPDGREDESTGAVCIGNLKGEAKANAYMKAETKSKRRVTLSICGLGLLDETEVESIPDAKRDNGEQQARWSPVCPEGQAQAFAGVSGQQYQPVQPQRPAAPPSNGPIAQTGAPHRPAIVVGPLVAEIQGEIRNATDMEALQALWDSRTGDLGYLYSANYSAYQSVEGAFTKKIGEFQNA
jgi:hypothetical protein